MKIVVCIKQVPDTDRISLDPKTGTLIREDVPAAINPFDLYAIEEGVRIKEKTGSQVKVISMGPPPAETALRDALALGCDEAFLLTDSDFAGADTLATSYTLACGIRKIGDFNLIICGAKTTDGDTGQVGPGLAQELDIPQITYVNKILEIDDHHIKAERLIEDGLEVINSPLPCLITVLKGINQPRLSTFKAKIAAKKASITEWGADNLDVDKSRVGLKGSPTHVVKLSTPPPPSGGEVFTGSSSEAIEKLVKKLQDLKLI